MMNEHAKPDTGRTGRPLEHGLVAVGISDRRKGAASQKFVNRDGLAGSLIEKVEFRFSYQGRTAIRMTNRVLMVLPMT